MRVRLLGAGGGDIQCHVAAAWPEAVIATSGAAGPVDVALIWDAGPAELAGFTASHSVARWLHTKASGLPAELIAAVRGRDVIVTNGTGTHGRAVAEHVLAVLLAHYRRLPPLLDAQRHRRWDAASQARELAGSTAGIIGLGDLGRATARALAAAGVTVLGLRRGAGDVPEVARTYRPAELAGFLAQLDALVIAAPLTAGTRGLIGAPELGLLPKGAFVVNVGRGPILAEEALVAAVRSGHLAGAALDVFADEPLPVSSALWSLPNVIITPHCADSTARTEQRCLNLLLDNVRRFRLGRPLRNVVNLNRGY